MTVWYNSKKNEKRKYMEDLKEKKVVDFVKNYEVKKIDQEKFKMAKKNNDFVFTKKDIMLEFDWKNGTFYNRLKEVKSRNKLFENESKKVLIDNGKRETTLFTYNAFCMFLEVYYLLDFKEKKQVSSKSQTIVNDSVKNESMNGQFDSNLTGKDSETTEDRISLYLEIIKQKDSMIESLQKQVEELTDIIKVKEQKDFEIARFNALKEQQKNIYLNDAEGNKKQGFFARLFGRKGRSEAE